jgi:hypothetical protein
VPHRASPALARTAGAERTWLASYAGFAVAEVREVDRLSRTCAARQLVAVRIPAVWDSGGGGPVGSQKTSPATRLGPPEEHHKERKQIESDLRSKWIENRGLIW